MRRRPSSRRAAVLFVFVGAAAAAAAGGTTAIQSPSASAPADLIVTNGAVYAADGRPMRQAVAVRGTEIVLVGSNEEIARLRGPGTTVVDAHGGAVVPGFNDVHAHMLSGGLEMDSAALQGAQTLDELQSRIRSYAAAHPQALWIRGRGWGYGPFGDKTPTREQLDAAIADRPAIMRCFDGHSVWLNSKALAAAHITKDTPDPPNGVIVRDPKTGEPTGLLKESPAMALVDAVVPKPTLDERRRALKAALTEALRYGVTSLTDAAGSPDDFAVYADLARAHDLPASVYYSLLITPGFTDKDADRFDAIWRAHSDSPFLKTGIVKMFMDGVIETNTAYMLAPYTRGGFTPANPPRSSSTPTFMRRAWGRNIGPERAARGGLWKIITDAHGRVVFGSDWPVASFDAMSRITSIVHRPPRPGATDQRLTMQAAVDDYTSGPAYASFDERRKGTLAPGMLADIVILATDVFSHAPATRDDVLVKTTILDGKVVFTRETRPTIAIDAAAPSGKVSPLFYGLMTEEINHAYDGGLYAELVQNRAFLDDAQVPVHWSVVQSTDAAASIALDRSEPLTTAIDTSLRLEVTKATTAHPAGVANDGYWGIPVKANTRYRASFYAKAAPGFTGPIALSIQSNDGQRTYATGKAAGLTQSWKKYEVTLQTRATTPTTAARYVLTIDRPGTVWLSLVSLFPPTFRDQPNGFRPDIMQMMVDMKPKFLRFPGGNYLEGDQIADRFEWKKTVGPLSERPGHRAPWTYRSSDGLGLYEYLLWCEDMNAEPLLAVYAGYSLKGVHVNPGPDLEPYVQDALDEIEYVTGPATSEWGALRAKAGHPHPFRLTYVEVGNEDWFDKSGSYDQRFAQFNAAIKSRYPQLKVISTVGFEQPHGLRVTSVKPDVLDEHYYRPVDVFLKMARGQYEQYDRRGPEIFVGEWAAYETPFEPWNPRSRGEAPTPNMWAAIGDAAFMTQMEKNSDIVVMNCYAPMFVNVNAGARQWRPNLIGYDGLRVYGSPSYHAIKMFSTYLGDQILKATATDTDVLVSATRDSRSGVIYLKLVNSSKAETPVHLDLQGMRKLGSTATVVTLAGDPKATNSIDAPQAVAPVTSKISGVKPGFVYNVPADSIVVVVLESR